MREKTILINTICLLLYYLPKQRGSFLTIYIMAYVIARRLDRRLGFEYTEYSLKCPLFQPAMRWLFSHKLITAPGRVMVGLTDDGKTYVEEHLLANGSIVAQHAYRVTKNFTDVGRKVGILPGWGKVSPKSMLLSVCIDKACLACGTPNLTTRVIDILHAQGWNLHPNVIGGVKNFYKILRGLRYDASVFKESAIRSCEMWDTSDRY